MIDKPTKPINAEQLDLLMQWSEYFAYAPMKPCPDPAKPIYWHDLVNALKELKQWREDHASTKQWLRDFGIPI